MNSDNKAAISPLDSGFTSHNDVDHLATGAPWSWDGNCGNKISGPDGVYIARAYSEADRDMIISSRNRNHQLTVMVEALQDIANGKYVVESTLVTRVRSILQKVSS